MASRINLSIGDVLNSHSYGKYEYFGSFDDLELAELVASEVRSKYHGDYANDG
ncbi:hypothetical protein ACED16_02520 [Enterobacter hormaechei]